MSEAIPDRKFNDLKEQLEHLSGDKDRIRIVSTAAESFTFTSEQIKQLCDVQVKVFNKKKIL